VQHISDRASKPKDTVTQNKYLKNWIQVCFPCISGLEMEWNYSYNPRGAVQPPLCKRKVETVELPGWFTRRPQLGVWPVAMWCDVVYLRTRPEIVLERIHRRGHKEELNVPLVSCTSSLSLVCWFTSPSQCCFCFSVCDFSCFLQCLDTVGWVAGRDGHPTYEPSPSLK